MAEAADSTQKLDDLTECSICTEKFVEPKLLPCCSHTFCLKCIELYTTDKNVGDEVPCPLCRRTFSVPDGGVAALTGNIFIEKLIDINKMCSIKNKDLKCDVCSVCESNELPDEQDYIAAWFCLNCSEHLCNQCYKVHRNQRVMKGHKVVEISNPEDAQDLFKYKTVFCKLHPDKQVDMFCKECKTSTCTLCFVAYHETHTFTAVSDVSEKFRKLLKADIIRFENYIKTDVRLLEILKSERAGFIERINSTEREIINKGEELKELVESHVKKLLNELNSIKMNALKEFDACCETIDTARVKFEGLKRHLQEVEKQASPAELGGVFEELRQKAKSFLDTHREDVDCTQLVTFKKIDSEVLLNCAEGNIVGKIIKPETRYFAGMYVLLL